jgi:hypothetical protein
MIQFSRRVRLEPYLVDRIDHDAKVRLKPDPTY